MKRYNIPQIKLVYVSDTTATKHKVSMSNESAEMFRQSYEHGEIEMQEYFKVMYLDRSMHVIGINTVSIGGMCTTIVDPKIVFGGALTAHAASLILCHNHPSGNPQPSVIDDKLTHKLVEGAKLLELNVLDHIIITTDSYFSYSDAMKLR